MIVNAVRVGGRLTCLSLLGLLGVFVYECAELHVHLVRGSCRMRTPTRRDVRLVGDARRRARVRLHWWPLRDDAVDICGAVSIVDALIHSVLCQPARHAVATLDSALNLGLIRLPDLSDIFSALPAKYGVLRPLIDGRAQSGPETIVRLLARALGCRIDLQVHFAGVGNVDLLLDGWLVVECDSKEFHSEWEQQVKDHNRDLALAVRGFVTLRLTAAQIMYRTDEVSAALRALVVGRRNA